MLNLERKLLLDLIERLGKEFEEYPRPHDVRLKSENIDVLREINSVVAGGQSTLTPELIREKCPTFVSVYRAVMLREIEELIPNGTDEEGRYFR